MITRQQHTLTGTSGAIFSTCEKFRYRLWREWDKSSPTLCFIMLNPSIANEAKNDATITRCESRAVGMGYGRLEVVNLFPYRATDPDELFDAADPVGDRDKADCAIMDAVERSRMVICGWGAHRAAVARADEVLHIIKITGHAGRLHHLGLNQDGSPKHPMYLARKVKPMRFEVSQ